MNNRYALTFAAILCLTGICLSFPSRAEDAKQDAPPPKESSASEGSALLEQARTKLAEYQSIKAELTERISFQDHSFVAKGSYLQGKRNQVRMEMTVELGSNRGALLEICDGNILYTRHDIIDQTQVTRRDVQKILQAVQKSGGRFSESSMIADLGLGGISGILAGIAADMNFKAPVEDELDGAPVYIIDGRWNDEFLSRFKNDPKIAPNDVQLPPFVPEQIRIILQKDSLFPRRITYLKRNPGGKISSPMLILEFSKIVFNSKVTNQQFEYVVDQAHPPTDVTEAWLQRLARASQQQQQQSPENPPPQQ